MLLCGSFIIIAVVFVLLKEKGVKLMAGFNDFSKEKQALYDRKKIVSDTKNSLLVWSAVLLVGGLLSFFSFYFGIVGGVVWLVLFCKNVKFDADKAFEKYKIH